MAGKRTGPKLREKDGSTGSGRNLELLVKDGLALPDCSRKPPLVWERLTDSAAQLACGLAAHPGPNGLPMPKEQTSCAALSTAEVPSYHLTPSSRQSYRGPGWTISHVAGRQPHVAIRQHGAKWSHGKHLDHNPASEAAGHVAKRQHVACRRPERRAWDAGKAARSQVVSHGG